MFVVLMFFCLRTRFSLPPLALHRPSEPKAEAATETSETLTGPEQHDLQVNLQVGLRRSAGSEVDF